MYQEPRFAAAFQDGAFQAGESPLPHADQLAGT